MTITHQPLPADDGKPSADELEAMREAERDRIEGNAGAFDSHTEIKTRLGFA